MQQCKVINNITVFNNLLQLRLWFQLPIIAIVSGLVIGIWLKDAQQYLQEDRRARIEVVVDVAIDILEFYHEQEEMGKLSTKEAQRQALAMLKTVRYNGTDYIWVHTIDPVPRMLMHPILPELDGKTMEDSKFSVATSIVVDNIRTELSNENLFQAMTTAIAKGKGHGFVEYKWPKPVHAGVATDELHDKISFVKTYPSWGWVVGTGIYTDDLHAAYAKLIVHVLFVGGLLISSFIGLFSIACYMGGRCKADKQ